MSIKSMPVWKWALLLLLSFILAFTMYGFSQGLGDLPQPYWAKSLAYIGCAVAMILLYALFVKLIEREPAKDIPARSIVPDTLTGMGIGFAFFVLVVIIMFILDIYDIDDIGCENPMEIVSAFFMFLSVGVGEEIIFRGILFRWIDEKWGFVAAMIVSALLFGFMHIFLPGATVWSSMAIAVEAGLLLGAAYKFSGTLWLPIGIHWAWNFTQGNIFGIEVSGNDAGESIFKSIMKGPDILTGGEFGAEASIITFVLGLALSVWFIIKVVQQRKNHIAQ